MRVESRRDGGGWEAACARRGDIAVVSGSVGGGGRGCVAVLLLLLGWLWRLSTEEAMEVPESFLCRVAADAVKDEAEEELL